MVKLSEYRKTDENGELSSTNNKIRFFGNPAVFLIFFSTLCFIEAAVIYGYTGGVLTTIEQRFQIPSTTAGTLSIISEISGLSVLIFVCYFGSKLYIPRVIGASGIIIGIGLLLIALPHLIFEPYQATGDYGVYDLHSNDTNNTLMCSSNNVDHQCSEEEREEVKHGRLTDIWPIVLGQVLAGFGTAGFYPLSVPYLDDSTKDSSTTGLYIAILYFIASIGPFAGFSVSARVLQYRTDFYYHNDKSVQTEGTGSIGAWWLGFVVFGILSIVFSIPILFFPRKLNVWESSYMSKCRRKPTDDDFDMAAAFRSLQQSEEGGGILGLIKGFLVALRRVATNLVFISLTLGIAAAMGVGTGIVYFLAKYLETQFDQDPATAAFLTGVMMLPGSLLGIVIGGALTSCLRMKHVGMCYLVLVLTSIAILINTSSLFIKCDQRNIAGLTVGYNSLDHSFVDELCNANCSCPSNVYQPICAPDGVTTYLSACHAGCRMVVVKEANITDSIFGGCSCFSNEDSENVFLAGACPRNCNKVMTYLVITILWSLVYSIVFIPYTMLVIRSVDAKDRALAMGFWSLLYRLLATIPAPIYFGAVIQSNCIFRSTICGQEGACLLYDTDKYRTRFVGLQIGLEIISFLLFIVTTIIIKRKLSASHSPLKTNNPDEEDDTTTI